MPSQSGNHRLPAGFELPITTIGVISDTHVPDRVSALHPQVIPTLRAAGVSSILHGGDVCVPSVLAQLNEVAPVTAVRGNRDFALLRLPLVTELEVAGVHIALMHGHGGIVSYLLDKLRFYLDGYRLPRYLNLLVLDSADARVVIFGHTHHPEILWYRHKLLFNPGSASFGYFRDTPPTLGLLHIDAQGRVYPEIMFLEGYKLKNRRWEPAVTVP